MIGDIHSQGHLEDKDSWHHLPYVYIGFLQLDIEHHQYQKSLNLMSLFVQYYNDG